MRQSTVTPNARLPAVDGYADENKVESSATSALAEIKAVEPRPDWRLWLGTLPINELSLALPLTILQAYDRILPNGALDTFTLMILGATAAILLEMLMRMARIVRATAVVRAQK
jgi:ABC-type protease/lipase transport system fused ATPase/permease subunit